MRTTAEALDRGSTNGERRTQPPRQEGCGLPSALRNERPATPGDEALLVADSVEDLPGKWQAAILTAAQNRPNLRLVSDA
jgi:hypothetical protein